MTLAGVAVMVILMIAVTWNDIMKLFLEIEKDIVHETK